MADVQKTIAMADQITSLAEDGLSGIGRTISAWPPEFCAIIWETVSDIASRRALAARAAVGEARKPV